MNSTTNNQENRQDRRGIHNPMYGRKHSQASREKMSQSATLRNQIYRDAINNIPHVTMDEFLANNPSIEEYIKVLVRHQINELIKAKELIENKQIKAIKDES